MEYKIISDSSLISLSLKAAIFCRSPQNYNRRKRIYRQRILEIGCKVRGAQKAIESIFDELLGNGYCGGKIRIHHCQNPEAAQILSKMIKDKFPKAEPVIDTTGALCSFYAESGGLPVGFECAKKR